MTSQELRQNFLRFFEKKGHKIVPSSSLLPTDPTVLFTTAGMQQFKGYYTGKPSPYGNRVTSCQKCFRTSDIEEVGDSTHLTFLEMLGNFAFQNDYFKKEAIEFAYELLSSKFRVPSSRLWITVFKGDKNVPADKESEKIWQEIGIPKERIFGFGREDNFWGPTGLEGPCGPTTEIHYDLQGKPCKKGKKCIPNCDCGRFVELWNLVFNEYYQDEAGKLTPLQQKGVDTGMGLERLAMVVQGKTSVFETDLFSPLMEVIISNLKYQNSKPQPKTQNFERSKRIIADHIKGAVFLASEGVFPSNVEQGYVLRRLLRRAIRFGKLLKLSDKFLIPLAKKVIEIYQDVYPELKSKEADILTAVQKEEEKFEKTLEKGLKQFEKIANRGDIQGEDAFHLYDTFGFPLELTKELAKEKGIKVDEKGFQRAFEKHREISRAGAEKKFGGIGKEASHEATKLHTATHLLHQALREVLGEHVKQMGSDITPERLRFDFSHPEKLTPAEIKKVEDLVNQKIQENLEVKKEEMPYKRAVQSGALAFFKEKYPEKVTVYSIGDFSKEICAGPHVERTKDLGYFKIIKEESVGAGLRRIKAVLE
jgi:alanyl-tRNA synthetase